MRTKIVAGNWKMHKNAEETEDLLNDLIDKLPNDVEARVIVAPTFVNLSSAVEHLQFTNIGVAAQNMHQSEAGAFTGEISADMLKSIGVDIVETRFGSYFLFWRRIKRQAVRATFQYC